MSADRKAKGETGISKRLLALMLIMGVAIGVVFPLFASLFVTPKSDAASLLFGAACVAAGVGLGLACYVVAIRTARGAMAEVLKSAGNRLGVSSRDVRGVEETQAELARVFESVADMHIHVREAYGTLRSLSTDILAATEEQASGSAEQAAAVAQTSATLEELAQTSRQIADNAESVAQVAERTLASAEEGMTAVADTAEGIEEIRNTTMQSSDRILQLGERSQEIGRVLSIIDEIAEQTKILALNAAIEAARAGEAGRGFSVVAEEIRQLADSVTESTQEIDRVVREIQSSSSALVMATEKAQNTVEEGRMLVERTGDALKRIVVNVEQTTDASKQISVATRQQRTASDQVVASMKEISVVSQQSAETSRHVSGAIQELTRVTDSLQIR